MTSLSKIPTALRDEFKVDVRGNTTVSQRGVARLAGVSPEAIRKLLIRIKKGVNLDGFQSLEPIAGQDFEGVNLDETAAVCILSYYAHEAGRNKTKQASAVMMAFGAIGFRTWVQKSLGWKEQARESRDDLRLSSKDARKSSMAALQAAGFVETHHYINVTQAAYKGLFGVTAKTLRQERGWPDGCNIRDRLNDEELAALRLIEINLQSTLLTIAFARSSDVNAHVKAVAGSVRAALAAGTVRPQLGA